MCVFVFMPVGKKMHNGPNEFIDMHKTCGKVGHEPKDS